jgi:hypothetical protein
MVHKRGVLWRFCPAWYSSLVIAPNRSRPFCEPRYSKVRSDTGLNFVPKYTQIPLIAEYVTVKVQRYEFKDGLSSFFSKRSLLLQRCFNLVLYPRTRSARLRSASLRYARLRSAWPRYAQARLVLCRFAPRKFVSPNELFREAEL